MKVNVLTNLDVEFTRFSRWSCWIDVSVFDYQGDGYLLQMKISKRNAKKFRCVKFASSLISTASGRANSGDLTQMKGADNASKNEG